MSTLRGFRITLVAIAAVGALALAGCSGGGSPTEATSTGTSALTAKPEVESLRIVVPSAAGSMDPLAISSTTDNQVLGLVGGTLFRLAPDGASVTPELAESATYSDDLTALTVVLREGVTFSDGTPLTAADVVATINRGNNPEVINNYASEYAPVTAVTAVDDLTVEFEFSRPYPSFQTILAFPEMSILKQGEIQDDGTIPEIPISAGQYVATGSPLGSTFTLERNANYAGDPRAVAQLVFTVVTDPDGRRNQVVGDQADMTTELAASKQVVEGLGAETIANVTDSFVTSNLTFNTTAAPLDEVGVRRAISLALDRDQISAIAWGGYAKPNAGFFPSSTIGSAIGTTTADVAAAEEQLVGTACETGCTIPLLIDGSSAWQTSTAVVVQQNLGAIGITVEIQQLDTLAQSTRLFEGNFQMAVSYVGEYADIPDLMPTICFSYEAGVSSCFSFLDSELGNSLANEANVAPDAEALRATYAKMNDFFADQAPLATLSDYPLIWAIQKDLDGYIQIEANAALSVAPLAAG